MSSPKVLLCGAVLGVIVSPLIFELTLNAAPAPARANDSTPARTPDEALEEFRECVRKRDYKAAAKYVGGDHRSRFAKSAEAASKLAAEIDSLLEAVQIVGLNSPDGRFVLQLLRPFPKDFEFTVTKPIKDEQYKILSKTLPDDFPPDQFDTLVNKVALAKLDLKLDVPRAAGVRLNPGDMEQRILLSLVPHGQEWDGLVAIKNVGTDKEKDWRILFPLTTDLPPKAQYLRENYRNYAQALKNVTYTIKHDAATKASFEADLSKELLGAK